MKDLTNTELQQVAGGTQYLVLTTRIDFEGIPAHCVENFFNANKDNAANIILDNIGSDIVKSCADFDGLANFSFSTDLIPIGISLLVTE